MRKIIALSSVLALAACGGDADVAEEEAVVIEEEVPTVVGTYTWNEEDGTAMTATISADGTTEILAGEEVVDSGVWREADDGATCFTMTVEEGEEATENCYTFGEMAEDGTVSVTDSDGDTDMVLKVS